MFIGNKYFWLGTFERAVKTLAQTAIALIGTGTITIGQIDWIYIASATAVATLLSVLTSIATPESVQYGGESSKARHVKDPDDNPDKDLTTGN